MDRLVRFLARLEEAEDLEDYRGATAELRASLGYDAFVYARLVPTPTRHGRPLPLEEGLLALTDYRGGWAVRYESQRYYRDDPVIRAAMGRILPVVWGPDFMAGRLSTAEDAVMRDAAAWRVCHGLSVVVRSVDGARGLFSLHASDEPWLGPGDVQIFHQAAIHLHVVLNRLARPADRETVPLSPRELDVLMWSAEGKTAAEIATILRISARTVTAHLHNAMRKMGVYSKTHAVAKFLTEME